MRAFFKKAVEGGAVGGEGAVAVAVRTEKRNVHEDHDEMIFRDEIQIVLDEFKLVLADVSAILAGADFLTVLRAEPFDIVEDNEVDLAVVEGAAGGSELFTKGGA